VNALKVFTRAQLINLLLAHMTKRNEFIEEIRITTQFFGMIQMETEAESHESIAVHAHN
jgi:hypothetical protein